jgi:hypothetical protein
VEEHAELSQYLSLDRSLERRWRMRRITRSLLRWVWEGLVASAPIYAIAPIPIDRGPAARTGGAVASMAEPDSPRDPPLS